MIRFGYILLFLGLVSMPGLPDAGFRRGPGDPPYFPAPETLTYKVEWRLTNAGTATVQLSRDNGSKGWNFNVNIESSGLVSRLYRVQDSYKVTTREPFCLANSSLDAREGRKHTTSSLAVDSSGRRLTYEERDLAKNRSEKKQLDISACTYEIVGALAILRNLNLPPGKVKTVPITDGKKFAQARVEAQAREKITVAGRSYPATRYEAFLFDNVLYRRHGRLLIWIGEGPEHLPLQLRLLLGFPIGTITVELQKQEK